MFASFVAAHTLGRCAAVVAMMSAPPAGDSGLGVSAARRCDRCRLPLGLVAGVGARRRAVAGGGSLPFLGAAVVGTGAVVVLAVRKIGGLAGDVLGAVEQVVECLVLVVASGLAARSGSLVDLTTAVP